MSIIPKLFRKTKTVKQIQAYMDSTFNEVQHTTLNPDGPGVIRIHLIPPKKEENALNPSVAIVNGTDIVPVNFAWAVILAEMIRETNHYDGKEPAWTKSPYAGYYQQVAFFYERGKTDK